MTIKQPVQLSRSLSPVRHSSVAANIVELSREQLEHFGIDPDSDFGRILMDVSGHIFQLNSGVEGLVSETLKALSSLPHEDRAAYFNAKKFLCFQLAKIIDTLQPGLRASYRSLGFTRQTQSSKGEHPLFCNVGTLFSATPAIVRSATYLYACTEWVDDAFHGRESTHPIYSRLMNPTSMTLANLMVELEGGIYAEEYMAWNFNSGMAAIDCLLGHLLNHNDILLVSRNVYGGTHQLLQDFYARKEKLNINLVWFDGYSGAEFKEVIDKLQRSNEQKVIVYLESPCNPHGYLIDTPEVCRLAHQHGCDVVLDSTLATPFLQKPLQQDDSAARPDFVIHSYTKDIAGSGNVTAGVVIGQNHRMFIPKGASCKGRSWEASLFWDAFYIKGSFLDGDKAFEVYNGIKTLESRMLGKCINTLIFARFLASHPGVTVNCSGIEGHSNNDICSSLMYLGLPCPLFTIDFEQAQLPRDAFIRFFDAMEPGFSHMVSLGQCNTLMLCPALTSHSELSDEALKKADISLTTIRIAMGNESPMDLAQCIRAACVLHLDPVIPGFSGQFMTDSELQTLTKQVYLDIHKAHIDMQVMAS